MIRRPPRSPLFPSTTLFRSFTSTTSRPTSPRWPARSSRRERSLDTSPPEPRLSALYQELILDHYRPPRNKGALEGATHSVSDRKSTRLNSSHSQISHAGFCL